MHPALDDVVFLARSENRLRVLEALVGEQRTRRELEETTGITRATLARILGDLEDRGWVIRTRGQCRASTEGALLAREFRALLDTVKTLEAFGELIEWFPVEDVTFDIGALKDAHVTRPSKLKTLDPITRFVSLIDETDRIRLLGTQHAPPTLEAMWEATVEEGRQRLELVLTADLVDTMLARSPDATFLADLVASDRADVYRASGEFDYNCGSMDGTVLFALSDDHGAPQALVECDDPTVHEWFETTFETHRREATLLDSDAVAE